MSLAPQPQKKNSIVSKVIIIMIKVVLFFSITFACIIGAKYAFDLGYEYVKDPEQFEKKASDSKEIEVIVPKGASTSQIADILKEKGLIKYPILFRAVSKVNRNDGLYKQGPHILNTSMEYLDIMNELKRTVIKKETTRFTIPEGFELRQIVDLLEEKKLIDREKFMHIVENEEFDYPFLKNLPKRKNRLEGYLFPDTYEVFADSDEKQIIKKMLDRFGQVFKEKYYQRAKELGMTVDEVVTLASIVEREAMKDDERDMVAAVFHNRLKSKQYPLLQSCATVQYVLGERKPILTEEDTRIESPYNTYIHAGLPVGPIASPGEKSIIATLYPADVDYLFFVARSDGSHVFSKTLQEHINAVNRIQKK